MIDRGVGGEVIFIGSLVVHIGVPNVSIYAMTKGELVALTKALAAEWAAHGVRVNCIIPGLILTELNAQTSIPSARAWIDKRQ